ncbi:hypothetical protein [Ureibacillus acetophenoni]
MKQSLKDVGALTEQAAQQIDAIEFSLPFSLIEDQIHQGALITGDAVSNFANRVAEGTKRYFVKKQRTGKIIKKKGWWRLPKCRSTCFR